MRWTLWQKRSICANCNARLDIPATGLMMVCDYCGTKQVVPDIEERTQDIRKTLSGPLSSNEKSRLEQLIADASKIDLRAKEIEALSKTLRRISTTIIVIGVIIVILMVTGVFNYVIAPLIGDPGKKPLQSAAEQLYPAGYVNEEVPTVKRYFFKPINIQITLNNNCYGLIVASSEYIKRFTLKDADGKILNEKKPAKRKFATLLYCSDKKSGYKAEIELKRPGRFSFQRFRKRTKPRRFR